MKVIFFNGRQILNKNKLFYETESERNGAKRENADNNKTRWAPVT